MDQITVSFPGLGIGEFTLNKVAFTLFGREVRWYGILVTLGFALCFFYVSWRAKKSEGIKPDDVLDTGLVCVICAIIGARLYYVLTTLENYHSFLDVIAIWNGGLAFYGGVIGGILAIFVMCKIKKIPFIRFCDAVAPALILAQVIGRWGNFFNGEAYGYQITDAGTTKFFFFTKAFSVPAGEGTLFHWLRMGLFPNDFSSSLAYVHPTFLYEGVWNLLGFLLLTLLYRKKKFNGQLLLTYFAWYGFGRMFIEGLRADSLCIFKTSIGNDGIRISQLVGLLCFVGCTAALIAISLYRRKHPAFAAYAAPAPAGSEPTEQPEAAPEESAEQPEEPAQPEQTEEIANVEEPAPVAPPAGEEPVKELPKAAPKSRRKPADQKGAVTLPVAHKKKKSGKKTTSKAGGKNHANH